MPDNDGSAPLCHPRACPAGPSASQKVLRRGWMPGSSPGMTSQLLVLGRLRLRALEEVDEHRGHLAFLRRLDLRRDEIDVEVAGAEVVELAPWDHAMRGHGDAVAEGKVVAGYDAVR